MIGIPNIFDTVVILDVLSESGVTLSQSLLEGAKKWLLDVQDAECQTWNFFIPGSHIIPNDIDTSSNTISCLYGIQAVSVKRARELAQNMVSRMWIHSGDNIPDIYMTKGPWPATWETRERIDVCVLVNMLYLLARLGIEDELNEKSFDACIKLIDGVLEEALKGVESEYLKNYDDLDVALFFISRLLKESKKARYLLGEKTEMLVMGRVGQIDIPLHMSWRILTAVNLDICRDSVSKVAEAVIGMINEEDNSWEKYCFYNARGKIYLGSKAVVTAFVIAALQAVKNKQINV